jgi:hypothetical protein
MSKIKKSWGFIKRGYRGCFENVYFQDILFDILKKRNIVDTNSFDSLCPITQNLNCKWVGKYLLEREASITIP